MPERSARNVPLNPIEAALVRYVREQAELERRASEERGRRRRTMTVVDGKRDGGQAA